MRRNLARNPTLKSSATKNRITPSSYVGKYSKNHWFYRWNSISSLFETREKLERNTAQGSTIQRLRCVFPCSPRHAPKTSEKALRKAQNWSPKAPRDPPGGVKGLAESSPGAPGDTPKFPICPPKRSKAVPRASRTNFGRHLGAIWAPNWSSGEPFWPHFG